MLLPDDPIEAQIHTVGRPLKGVDVKITDGERRKLPVGKPGEIAVRSPGQMWGYFNDPEKTSAAFDDQNYYYTGDIGCMDENGYLRILDRKKDMIIRGAQNIYPSEIENYLNTHPKVHMSAVIGVPSKISDEIVRVYIQLEKGEDMSATEIVDFCRGQIAAYKIPQEVRFVDNFPLGGSMKVKKQDLREKALKELDLGNK
jgi:acyl-CoA synthetase (AMP-forming)/AMP-acid ligase II